MSQENTVQKKSSPKIVVITLAVICVILAASLVGVIAIYQPNSQAQSADKDATISALQEQITALNLQLSNTANATTYVAQIAYLNQQISALNDSLNDTITSANDDITSLESILKLQASGLLYDNSFVQDANVTSTTLWSDTLEYAGYVIVEATATSNTTYAEALYTFNGVNFAFNQTLGTSGTALFPVMPGTVTVNIGYTNTTAANNVAATATYYY
jgi:hypothetical protein